MRDNQERFICILDSSVCRFECALSQPTEQAGEVRVIDTAISDQPYSNVWCYRDAYPMAVGASEAGRCATELGCSKARKRLAVHIAQGLRKGELVRSIVLTKVDGYSH